ncbi:MAG: FkbM family methyltransferase [Firmicutes bacterium]|nr:FkbM family methyltransferase [Bacillota bacterium]
MKKTSLPDIWQALAASPDSIWLYGTGDGADKILNVMNERGLWPVGVFVSDDFYRGQMFHGFSVLPLSEIQKIPQPFTLVISFGSHLPVLIERIKDLAARFPVVIPDVPVAGKELFDRTFFETHARELNEAKDLLSDDSSREVFDQVIDYKLTGDPVPLFSSVSPKEDVLRELFSHHPDEIPSYIDCGAYRGDTIEEFFRYFPRTDYQITALEPDPGSFKKLRAAFGADPKIHLIRAACGNGSEADEPDEILMVNGRGRGTHVPALTEGVAEGSSPDRLYRNIRVPLVRLDDLDFPVPPTYLKMDIEGQEKEALLGASNLIRTYRPLLNIACYHRSADLFVLPKLIHDLYPGYRICLRRHDCFPCWDLNLYCTI